MLKITNLKKYFGGVKAVDGCDFEVKKNTITALIGPNGSGKSTVFNLVSGILKADKGSIYFTKTLGFASKHKNTKTQKHSAEKQEFVEITNLPPEKISNLGISRLFQQSRLFNNLTVKDNLLLAIGNEDMKFFRSVFKPISTGDKNKKIKEMLKAVELEKIANKLTRDLSYGQKRLLEIIRAILNPHSFLMLDEPAAGVNPALRKKIAEILLKLKSRGETVLLIEHDMNFTLSIADKVVVMEKGRVIAQGSPDEIRNNPEVLEAYLGE
ncbi:ABC transporter ATP-binding protein [Patescibacteria group bacterium]|nr:ABC transporter ATP-binding protein [Candidatus Falkowbacteria bacterium]MBU3906351.1 ABC transporter ATP-binding protein [Patescibacteria group bacterium]MBU4026726.1 ABC transporter ATP-binding protein [Patescibacteria group bacterium]MBU4072535.1 ABC transporter ATP-binding protein [Patescibacteria group bacterium]MBU4102645.1 ABC transporter ATP-binding protein [Patescibacteria group bacterium]